MSQRGKLLWVPLLLIATVISDQATKSLAIAHLKWQGSLIYLGNLFRLEYSENPGAFLSLGSRLSPELRFWLLTVFVAAFLIGALIFL
ncbi:MAG: signal peptidase II, partial [Bdellovibrionota bacterium]